MRVRRHSIQLIKGGGTDVIEMFRVIAPKEHVHVEVLEEQRSIPGVFPIQRCHVISWKDRLGNVLIRDIVYVDIMPEE